MGNKLLVKMNKFRLTNMLVIIPAIFLTVLIFQGCSYYRVTSSSYPSSEQINPLVDAGKTFVLHSNSGISVINNLKLENDSITADYLYTYQLPYNNNASPDVNSSNRYSKNKGDYGIIKEVHLYIQNVNTKVLPGLKTQSFAIQDVYRFDIYNPDHALTALSWFFSIAGIIVVSPF